MRGLSSTVAALLAGLTALLGVGCGTVAGSTPLACLGQSGAYLSALKAAPGMVRLGGRVPISACLPSQQPEGELATVGMAMVTAATRLNAEARVDPGGSANLALGYLLGADGRGGRSRDGVQVELLRRLAAAARYSPDGRPLPPPFWRAYRRGYGAGQSRG